MRLEMTFQEQDKRFGLDFGEVQDMTDGGYERGYAAGYTEGEASGYEKGHTTGAEQGYAGALAKRTDIVITENGEYTPSDGSTGFKSVSVSVRADGGGDLDAFIDRTIVEVGSDIAEIGLYAFTYCAQLVKADFPSAKKVNSYAFQYCSALSSVNLPQVQSVGGYGFMSCTALASIDLPAVLSVSNYAFRKCSALATIDLYQTYSIGTFAFYECTNLEAVILRKTDKICTLSAANAFQYTKIADGVGYIYVPAALVGSYKSDGFWSTYAAQFRAIEDFPEITT